MAATNDQIQDYVRFWLANLSESDISSEDFDKIIELVRTQYPDATDCQYYYYVTVAVLNWLIRQASQGSAGSVGTGEISKIREKRGSTEKEVTYDTGTSSGETASWDTILEDLLESPDSIGCQVYSEGESVSRVAVNIGGSRVDQTLKVRSNPNSNSAYRTPRIMRKFGPKGYNRSGRR